MAQPLPPTVSPADVFRTLVHQPSRWLGPTALIAIAALVFAIVRPRTWEAAQALVVRDEVSLDAQKQVNSTRADDVKAAQETILELVHTPGVLEKSLREVGPLNGEATEGFPTAKDVEELGDAIKLTPPKGGEFGKTDIFYLKAEAPERERALALAGAVSHHLQASYEELRKTKANSLIQELDKTVSLAQQSLDTSTCELAAVERSIGGADLAELRILNELPSGTSDMRNEAAALEAELRKEKTAEQANRELLNVLEAAQVDPGELVASPSSLLASQPSLKRLKDGLVDAQLKSAMLMGAMSADHPQVLAARRSEQQIGEHLHDELAIAIKGVEADLKLNTQHIETVEAQKASLRARLDKLVDVRARYGNLVASTKHRADILKSAETELAEARAKLAATNVGSVLQLIGEPVTGTRPVGPGRTMIVLAGILGGLIVGLGIVVLTARPLAIEEPKAEPIFQVPVKRANRTRTYTPNSEPTVVAPSAVVIEEPALVASTSYTSEPEEPELVYSAAVSTAVATLPAALSEPLTFKQALAKVLNSDSRN